VPKAKDPSRPRTTADHDAASKANPERAAQLVAPAPVGKGWALMCVHRSKGDDMGADVVAYFHTRADAEEYCRLREITLRSFGGWPDWDEYDIYAVHDGKPAGSA
jgi:hypothetical protein